MEGNFLFLFLFSLFPLVNPILPFFILRFSSLHHFRPYAIQPTAYIYCYPPLIVSIWGLHRVQENQAGYKILWFMC